MIKFNADGAVFEAFNCFSYAFVIHGHAGELIEAKSKCCACNISPKLEKSWVSGKH